MTILTRSLDELEGYDFTRTEDLVAEVRWTHHAGAVVAESYENVLRIAHDDDEALEAGQEAAIVGRRLYWLARRLDPSIDREDRERSEEIETRERKLRMLGHELDSARRGRDEAETREHRGAIRADGLALTIDLLARRVGDSEHEHDETIAELRRTEEDLDEARTRIAELEAALEGLVVTAEIVDDEEPF